MIDVLIADDHQISIDGIKAILKDETDIQVAGEANNGREVLDLLKANEPDVILMDINMPEMDGIEATRQISLQYPKVKVLTLTMYDEIGFIEGIIKAGAKGYILKNSGTREMLDAIRTVYEGGQYYNDEIANILIKGLQEKHREKDKADLTRRETEVLKLIAREYTSHQIARELYISFHTVESHRKNIHSKLGVKNLAGLVKYALENGLLDDD